MEERPMGPKGSDRVRQCIIVTGLSGSGKSTALHILEDQGMFSIDNIPARMLSDLVESLGQQRSAVEKGLAVVIDARDEYFLEDLDKVLNLLRERGIRVSLLFLDSSEAILLRRFETTRRSHPIATGEMTLLEGIRQERALLDNIREKANICIDTSLLSPRNFRERLLSELGLLSKAFRIVLTSFGFKFGPPQDCDFLFDVRFLPNPFYVEALRDLSGLDSDVRNYVFEKDYCQEFYDKVYDLIMMVLPPYSKTGKGQIHFAFGCTGGRHRSVSMVEKIADQLGHLKPVIRHRDIGKDSEISN